MTINEADFRSYVAAFNRSDFDFFSRFYDPNVEFRGRAADCNSREEIVSFYQGVHKRVREKLTVHALIVGPHAICADVETELYAL